jgi:hypothetical protein
VQRPGQALYQLAARGHQRLGEQRAAMPALVHRVDQPRLGNPAQDAGELIAHLGPRQRAKLDPAGAGHPVQAREQQPERIGLDLIGAERGHDHDRGITRAGGQEAQQVAGGPVGPVQVLDDDDERLLFGERLQQAEQRPEQPGGAQAGVAARWRRAELGQQPG